MRPTIEEPLRADWDVVRAEVRHARRGRARKRQAEKAVARVPQASSARSRVLDPACGTGNFLYVTLDLFKRLESEVLGLLARPRRDGRRSSSSRASPSPPRSSSASRSSRWAKEIAELVLWIGYLQWHFRTHGDSGAIREPVLRDYGNIECRDAVLAWDRIEPVLDDARASPSRAGTARRRRRAP